MIELKTLENLSKTTIMVPDLTKKQPCKEELVPEIHVPNDELRDAAREWIKALNTMPVTDFYTKIIGTKAMQWAHPIKTVQLFLYYFFNLEGP